MANRKISLIISRLRRDDTLLKDLKALLLLLGIELEDDLLVPGEPEDIKTEAPLDDDALILRIKAADALLVLITQNTRSSKSLNRQIEFAMKQGKRIIGVFAPGAKESAVPASFAKFGDSLVSWKSDQILQALEGKLDGKWSDPAGEPIRPRDIPRYDCSDD